MKYNHNHLSHIRRKDGRLLTWYGEEIKEHANRLRGTNNIVLLGKPPEERIHRNGRQRIEFKGDMDAINEIDVNDNETLYSIVEGMMDFAASFKDGSATFRTGSESMLVYEYVGTPLNHEIFFELQTVTKTSMWYYELEGWDDVDDKTIGEFLIMWSFEERLKKLREIPTPYKVEGTSQEDLINEVNKLRRRVKELETEVEDLETERQHHWRTKS